jgi:hypothetical protein
LDTTTGVPPDQGSEIPNVSKWTPRIAEATEKITQLENWAAEKDHDLLKARKANNLLRDAALALQNATVANNAVSRTLGIHDYYTAPLTPFLSPTSDTPTHMVMPTLPSQNGNSAVEIISRGRAFTTYRGKPKPDGEGTPP